MNDEQIEQTILLLGKQMIKVEGELIALKNAVNVLKSCLAMNISPADPKGPLEEYQRYFTHGRVISAAFLFGRNH